MSKIDEVKALITAGEIEQARALVLGGALKIEIITSITDGDNSNSDPQIRSVIDLLNNEIEHELDQNILNHRHHQEINNLHFQEVEKAHDTILQNLQSLQQIFSLIQEI
ncbi:MAG: hypothetical protein IGQ45_12235 [Cyanobacterium sp. T60_A2020_053]|nr:hypothetical protein [Cyanobacterium sp. T60_A2020_053]